MVANGSNENMTTNRLSTADETVEPSLTVAEKTRAAPAPQRATNQQIYLVFIFLIFYLSFIYQFNFFFPRDHAQLLQDIESG